MEELDKLAYKNPKTTIGICLAGIYVGGRAITNAIASLVDEHSSNNTK